MMGDLSPGARGRVGLQARQRAMPGHGRGEPWASIRGACPSGNRWPRHWEHRTCTGGGGSWRIKWDVTLGAKCLVLKVLNILGP